MKKVWILTLTVLSVSLFFTACSFKLGENSSAKSDTEKRDEEKTEKIEKNKNDKKSEKIVAKNDEETIAEDKETAPDPKSNALSGSERPTGESDSVSNALGEQAN